MMADAGGDWLQGPSSTCGKRPRSPIDKLADLSAAGEDELDWRSSKRYLTEVISNGFSKLSFNLNGLQQQQQQQGAPHQQQLQNQQQQQQSSWSRESSPRAYLPFAGAGLQQQQPQYQQQAPQWQPSVQVPDCEDVCMQVLESPPARTGQQQQQQHRPGAMSPDWQQQEEQHARPLPSKLLLGVITSPRGGLLLRSSGSSSPPAPHPQQQQQQQAEPGGLGAARGATGVDVAAGQLVPGGAWAQSQAPWVAAEEQPLCAGLAGSGIGTCGGTSSSSSSHLGGAAAAPMAAAGADCGRASAAAAPAAAAFSAAAAAASPAIQLPQLPAANKGLRAAAAAGAAADKPPNSPSDLPTASLRKVALLRSLLARAEHQFQQQQQQQPRSLPRGQSQQQQPDEQLMDQQQQQQQLGGSHQTAAAALAAAPPQQQPQLSASRFWGGAGAAGHSNSGGCAASAAAGACPFGFPSAAAAAPPPPPRYVQEGQQQQQQQQQQQTEQLWRLQQPPRPVTPCNMPSDDMDCSSSSLGDGEVSTSSQRRSCSVDREVDGDHHMAAAAAAAGGMLLCYESLPPAACVEGNFVHCATAGAAGAVQQLRHQQVLDPLTLSSQQQQQQPPGGQRCEVGSNGGGSGGNGGDCPRSRLSPELSREQLEALRAKALASTKQLTCLAAEDLHSLQLGITARRSSCDSSTGAGGSQAHTPSLLQPASAGAGAGAGAGLLLPPALRRHSSHI